MASPWPPIRDPMAQRSIRNPPALTLLTLPLGDHRSHDVADDAFPQQGHFASPLTAANADVNPTGVVHTEPAHPGADLEQQPE